MPSNLTAEQILSLAPDSASAKAGRQLAVPKNWTNPGCDEKAAWGECKGSAKLPYQVQIDFDGPTFKCNCPSHKFPCKHGLALFLLLESQPAGFAGREQPPWVAAWLQERVVRAEKQSQKSEAPKSANPAAQARRAAERQSKVKAGLEELELWLRDVIRQGLAAVPARSQNFWEAPAARMVDAQAPAIARQLRNMGGLAMQEGDWQTRVLERLGRLYLLLEGYKRIDALPLPVQADIRDRIGFTQNQENLLASAGIRSEWLVVGQRMEDDGQLKTQYTWLWSRTNGQPALLLQFAAFGGKLEGSLVPGTCIDAELVFYTGAVPLRALVKACFGAVTTVDCRRGYETIETALDAYARALARNPWTEQFPIVLENVTPIRSGERWRLVDTDESILPLPSNFKAGWQLLAISGGRPISLFGEWDGVSLLPLSCCSEGQFLSL